MKLPHGIELEMEDGRLLCINCGAEAPLKKKARFLRRHPVACVRAKLERKAFVKQLSQGTRSVDDTERRGGKYGTIT